MLAIYSSHKQPQTNPPNPTNDQSIDPLFKVVDLWSAVGNRELFTTILAGVFLEDVLVIDNLGITGGLGRFGDNFW